MVQTLSRNEGNDEDEPRSGRPSTSRTSEMIEKVRQMMTEDRRLTLSLIVEKLGIRKKTAHTFVREKGKRKTCFRFVPHKLTDEQKARGNESVEISLDFICMCAQDPLLLENIVTGDETCCYEFDPESKRQWMAWCSPLSPRPKQSPLQKSKVKTLLIAFFDNKGIIHKEFVPAGQTIRAAYYQAVLNRLLQRIQRVRPELNRIGKWMLLYDNVSAHGAIRVRHTPYTLIWLLGTSSCFPAWRRPSKVHVLWTWMPSKIYDSRSAIDSTGGLCLLFSEAVRTLSNVCCCGWRLFWRTVKKICL